MQQQKQSATTIEHAIAVRDHLFDVINRMYKHHIHHVDDTPQQGLSIPDKLRILDEEITKYNAYLPTAPMQMMQMRTDVCPDNPLHMWDWFGWKLQNAFDMLHAGGALKYMRFELTAEQDNLFHFDNNGLMTLFSSSSRQQINVSVRIVKLGENRFGPDLDAISDYDDILRKGVILYLLTQGHLSDSLWKKVTPFIYDGFRRIEVEEMITPQIATRHRRQWSLPSRVQTLLEKMGDYPVQNIIVVRTPPEPFLFDTRSGRTPQVHPAQNPIHLFLFLETDPPPDRNFLTDPSWRGDFVFEKRHGRVNLQVKHPHYIISQSWPIRLQKTKTLRELVENALQKIIMHPTGSPYEDDKQFVWTVLQSNGLLTSDVLAFIHEDVGEMQARIRRSMQYAVQKQRQRQRTRFPTNYTYQERSRQNDLSNTDCENLYWENELTQSCIGYIATLRVDIRENATGTRILVNTAKKSKRIADAIKKNHLVFKVMLNVRQLDGSAWGHANCFLYTSGKFFYIEPNGTTGDSCSGLTENDFKTMWKLMMDRLRILLDKYPAVKTIFDANVSPVFLFKDAHDRPYRSMHSKLIDMERGEIEGYCVTLVLYLVDLFRQNACLVGYVGQQREKRPVTKRLFSRYIGPRLQELFDIYLIISQATGQMAKDLRGFNAALTNDCYAMKTLERIRQQDGPNRSRRNAIKIPMMTMTDDRRYVVDLRDTWYGEGQTEIMKERRDRIGADKNYTPLKKFINTLYQFHNDRPPRTQEEQQRHIYSKDGIITQNGLFALDQLSCLASETDTDVFKKTVLEYLSGHGERKIMMQRLKNIIHRKPMDQMVDLIQVFNDKHHLIHDSSEQEMMERRRRMLTKEQSVKRKLNEDMLRDRKKALRQNGQREQLRMKPVGIQGKDFIFIPPPAMSGRPIKQLIQQLYRQRVRRSSSFWMWARGTPPVPTPQEIMQGNVINLTKLKELGTGGSNKDKIRQKFLLYLSGNGDAQDLKEELRTLVTAT